MDYDVLLLLVLPCLSSCVLNSNISSQLEDEDGNSKNNQPIISSLFRMDCVNFIFLLQQKLQEYT